MEFTWAIGILFSVPSTLLSAWETSLSAGFLSKDGSQQCSLGRVDAASNSLAPGNPSLSAAFGYIV